jgi:hypothetical protein
MVNHSARGSYRGSILWPGRGRSQSTQDPIGRSLARSIGATVAGQPVSAGE